MNKNRQKLNGAAQKGGTQIPGDVSRYVIFEMLVKKLKLTVSDIAKTLKLPIPLASEQLKALEQINILEKEKKGEKIYYKFRVDNAVAQAIINY